MTNFSFLAVLAQQSCSRTNKSSGNFTAADTCFRDILFFHDQAQMKKQKEMNNYRNSLKRGDKVVTTGVAFMEESLR